jgi:hypothetical protein
MRSSTKAWPARLLAAVLVLALTVAAGVGAYAHAAGHGSPSAGHAAADAGDYAGPLSESVTSQPGQVGHAHDCGGTDQAPFDCCDTICHGGQAILAAAVLVPHAVLPAPLIQPASAFDSAEPDGLDRPPKPFRSA